MYHYANAVEALADEFPDDPVLTHDGAHRTWRDFVALVFKEKREDRIAQVTYGSDVDLRKDANASDQKLSQ